ncbi:MAG TPA: redoxin domain-containing protein [Chitinophagales bacterium]|nr:redoxin domain-containing protein [Chitinophagales bacterium]HRK26981.1 redoxin domain-containing protein [Chitinophagales bacterium]
MRDAVTRIVELFAVVWLLMQAMPVYGQQEGALMPDFTLFSIRGEQVTLSAMKNKYVLLNFGQTGCPTFGGAQATLMALERKYAGVQLTNADGLEVISISLDNDIAQLKKALAPYGEGLRYEIMVPEMYESAVVKKYGVTQLNTTFFIGPGNRLIGKNLAVNEIESHLQSSAMVEEIFYRVYLGIFPVRTEYLRTYNSISHLGVIYKQKNNPETMAVYLERYSTPQEAEYAKAQAINAGYQEAQVVMFKNNLVVASAPGEVAPTATPVKPAIKPDDYFQNSTPRDYSSMPNTAQSAPPPSYKNQPVGQLGQEQIIAFSPPQSYLNQNPNWKLMSQPTTVPAPPQSVSPQQPYYAPPQPPQSNDITSREYTPNSQPVAPNSGYTPQPQATPAPIKATAAQIAQLEQRLTEIERRMSIIASELQQLIRESNTIREEINRLKGF